MANTSATADSPAQVTDVALQDRLQIEAVHAFLTDQMGRGLVEDLGSFVKSLSPDTDPAVVPAAVTARQGDAIVGAIVGAYLPEVNVGMVLYSAVSGPARGHGVYTSMRRRLVDALSRRAGTFAEGRNGRREGPATLSYMVSEVERGTRLHRAYGERWGAFEVRCDYVQPPVQGLEARELTLMFQPLGRNGPPDRKEVVSVVREIYGRVYRMPAEDYGPYLSRVVESVREPACVEGVRQVVVESLGDPHLNPPPKTGEEASHPGPVNPPQIQGKEKSLPPSAGEG